MTKEAARKEIQNLQDAITKTLGDAGKPAVDILGALLSNGGNDPIIFPSVETPPRPDPADNLGRGYTTDFRFRAKSGKDRKSATE